MVCKALLAPLALLLAASCTADAPTPPNPTLPTDPRFKPLPNGQLLAPLLEHRGSEHDRLLGLELRDPSGTPLTRFLPAEGMRFSRPSADHVTLATPTRVIRYALDGHEQWSFPFDARELAVAAHADRVLAVPASDSRRLVVLADGKQVASADLREPIWNLALSSDGERAAVTTEHGLHTLSRGRLQLNLKLPLRYATSLALADDGRVLVGGRRDDHLARVLCFSPAGRLLEEQVLARDEQAFRPALRWLDAERYLAIDRDGEHEGRCPTEVAR